MAFLDSGPNSQNESKRRNQNDEVLLRMVDNLHDMSLDIGNKIKHQNEMVDTVEQAEASTADLQLQVLLRTAQLNERSGRHKEVAAGDFYFELLNFQTAGACGANNGSNTGSGSSSSSSSSSSSGGTDGQIDEGHTRPLYLSVCNDELCVSSKKDWSTIFRVRFRSFFPSSLQSRQSQ